MDTFGSTPFSTPSDLFGSDTQVVRPRKFLHAEPTPPPTQEPGPPRPVIRKDFVSPEDARIEDTAPATFPYVTFEGQFSGVRTVRISHQWRLDFWGGFGVMEYLAETSAADPSEAELTQSYDDLLLFNYLPQALTPSVDDYNSKATPSRREAELRAATVALQHPVKPVVNPVTAPESTQLLQALPPFADSLKPFCSDRIFSSVVDGTGGRSVLV